MTVRTMTRAEAENLAEDLRRHHLFARVSFGRNLYVARAQSLAEQTIVEMWLPGDPEQLADSFAESADRLEQTVLLASILSLSRAALHRRLITLHTDLIYDLMIGPAFYSVRSRLAATRRAPGVLINQRYANRLAKNGFQQLLTSRLTQQNEMAWRVLLSSDFVSLSGKRFCQCHPF